MRLAIGAVILLALGAGYWFWLRDSSLVAVDDVDVVGVTVGDRGQIVGALTAAAEEMTTLHVDRDRIEAVAAGFPTIESASVDPNFPHGMRIEIAERLPALLVRAGGDEVPVAGDGTVLGGVSVPDDADLPVIEADEAPASGRLEGPALQQALVAGATPEPLRPLVERLELSKDYGVEVILRGGIPVRFGTGARASAKWAAASAALADPKLDGLSYLDVRVPERPAAGGAM